MAFDVAASALRRGKRRATPRPDMNVTPLVDVVLVLLIVFMVITPMLAKQFWVHVPTDPDARPEPPPTGDQAPIVVTVDREGTIRLQRDVVAPEALPVRLRRVLAARGDRTVFFDAASDAPYGRAAQVLDLCRGAGASTIAVSTEALADAR